jgi:hypothetical protein
MFPKRLRRLLNWPQKMGREMAEGILRKSWQKPLGPKFVIKRDVKVSFCYLHLNNIVLNNPLVSIGISHNILLARLATRAAKPAKSFHLLPDQVSTHISPLDIRDLPGVGYSIRDKIETKFGVRTCGEVRDKISKEALQKTLGDGIGAKMWDSVRGIDHSPLGVEQKRKSVSAEVNVSRVYFSGLFYIDSYAWIPSMESDFSPLKTPGPLCITSRRK